MLGGADLIDVRRSVQTHFEEIFVSCPPPSIHSTSLLLIPAIAVLGRSANDEHTWKNHRFLALRS